MNEIEKMYYDAMVDLLGRKYLTVINNCNILIKKDDGFYCVYKDGDFFCGFTFCEQVKIGKYIADFCISIELLSGSFNYIIEIDGHDWHEKTKKQASSDKKRERELLSMLNFVLRYSGSDVFNNKEYCVEDTIKTILSSYINLTTTIKNDVDEYSTIDNFIRNSK